ncbi:MAG: type I-C CRISPR-associated protein Cas8c/Csd1 [Lentisphaeria bacterium]|nr:type I-C CRISPR-associated protein Cas8c/Csd1 [Lentisphaeria bacterium]
MILQALKEYYDRMAADEKSGIAPQGWEWKEIPFLIVINENGSLVRVEDTQELVGKKKRAKVFLVPQSVKRSSGIASNLLWDNVEYVTGIVCKGTPQRVAAQHSAFLERLATLPSCKAIDNIRLFLFSPNYQEQLTADSTWQEAVKNCAFVSFKMERERQPVFRDPLVISHIEKTIGLGENDKGKYGRCLVSGQSDIIAELHPAIKGVQNTNTTGGNIISFNFPAACSFGKTQGNNAPVSKRSAFEYTTALNTLLGKDSHQKMQVGDATTVFWASKPTTLENDFADMFIEPPKDNPDRGVDAVNRLLSSVKTGAFVHEKDETRFYVLGLSPNAARITVRFWHDGTVAEMEKRFADWFENLRIVHAPDLHEHLSLWRLLLSLAPQSKSDNIPPNLAGAVMRSILEGTPYPTTLLLSALVRIKAERDVGYPRAKLIKAFLNHNHKRNLTMSLDKDNTNIGYRLGRLFATLEKLQLFANPGINATIRDKFYASASATPSAVFGNLMRLSGHHLSKLDSDKKALRIWLEKQIEEIMSGISSFPMHLSLEDQGMFAIGYYHQRMEKKEDSQATKTSEI